MINTIVSVAFKNYENKYNIKRLYIFELTSIDKYFHDVNVYLIKNKQIEIRVKCPICGEYHYYRYNIKDFMKISMVIGGCEKLGLPLFFIGDIRKVEDRISKYEEINKKIYAMI